MRLKRIRLKNIRSYQEHEINFNEGSTLLMGDIGAGKTSILLGIEFGLFGLQPGQKGTSILRNGEDFGEIEIDFEIEEHEVKIERNLKRGSKSITQDYCAITIDGQKTESSVTEIKDKVLTLLGYPKEFAKKQNLLYKFTVYTPQEEMKQIILEDSNTRLNTLRHVFGVDKYKKILENSAILLSKIREEKRTKEGQVSMINVDKELLKQKEINLISTKSKVSESEADLIVKTNERKKVEIEKKELQSKIEEKNKLIQEAEKTKIMITTKKDSLFSNQQNIKQLKNQILEAGNLEYKPERIDQLKKELEEYKITKIKLSENILNISSQITSLNMKNQDNDSIKQKISKMDICPTCLQDVDPNYKANVVNKADSNTSENIRKIEELIIEKQKLSSDINNIEERVSFNQERINELNLTKIKLQGIEEKHQGVMSMEAQNTSMEKDISFLQEHLDAINSAIFELKKYDNLFLEKQRQLDTALALERKSEISLAEIKKEIDMLSIQVYELDSKIKKSEEIQSQLIYISGLEDWISKKFVPIISVIEKNVMTTLKVEFSKLFSEWFSMLVSDNFSVRLDEEFTPIIEQQDYEIEYAYLSGGERTAVALAYRLALNQVINSLLSKIKTRDLVILDEPTDGFSSTQLDKMRDVLLELKVGQLIIVSHEQKIEGFVDNVIRIKKEAGVTHNIENIEG